MKDVIALTFLDALHGCGEFNIVTVNFPTSFCCLYEHCCHKQKFRSLLVKQTFNVIMYSYLTFSCWKESILIFCVILSRY